MILMVRPLLRYADFKGRASRAEFWLFKLFQLIAYAGLLVFLGLALTGDNGPEKWPLVGLFFILILVVNVGCLVPNLAVMVRRLHDINRSAWWLCLYLPGLASATVVMIGLAGALHGGIEALAAALLAAGPLASLAGLCDLVIYVLMGLRGTTGANRYGDDPKSPRSVTVVINDEDRLANIDRAIERYKAPTATATAPASGPVPQPTQGGFGKRRAF